MTIVHLVYTTRVSYAHFLSSAHSYGPAHQQGCRDVFIAITSRVNKLKQLEIMILLVYPDGLYKVVLGSSCCTTLSVSLLYIGQAQTDNILNRDVRWYIVSTRILLLQPPRIHYVHEHIIYLSVLLRYGGRAHLRIPASARAVGQTRPASNGTSTKRARATHSSRGNARPGGHRPRRPGMRAMDASLLIESAIANGGLAGLEHEALVRDAADRVRVVEAEHGFGKDVED